MDRNTVNGRGFLMFTKKALMQAAKTGAIVIVGVALAETFGIMNKIRGLVGAKVGVTSEPMGAAPEPIILEGFEG
jgi:phosphohistidine swiveling domain-containing protein